ncbi:MAG: methylmalonyl-CoA mutase family protein [Chloroflexota bacterium]
MADIDEVKKRRKQWEEGTLKNAIERFKLKENPNRFYTPADIKDFDFLEKIGFPGEYPFTTSEYPVVIPRRVEEEDSRPAVARVTAGAYSGFGTAEDTRDYYKQVRSPGPNVAFQLPTQCGYDSDSPEARGEVGKVGVAIDTLRDFEVLYEAFTGDRDLDRIASNWTINGLTNIILAMYIAIAEKRGIPINKLRGTPQNDILKEYLGRGTQNFPPRPSMRMTRDTIVYCTKHMPLINWISISGHHVRDAGATVVQACAFQQTNMIAYVQTGIDAGLDIDEFVPRMTLYVGTCGGMEFFENIAAVRANRRMCAKILKERFKAKNPRSWIPRDLGAAAAGLSSCRLQRPLNNLTRGVIGGVMGALSGGQPSGGTPFDEPLGLGHSPEAQQLSKDATRIMMDECHLGEVIDPLAGSYYVESLTDKMESEIQKVVNDIEARGGAVACIETGYSQRMVSKSAHQFQSDLASGRTVIVGVNKYTSESEIEVMPSRLVPEYDPRKREEAEEKQLLNLARVKRERDNAQVKATLARLKDAAKDESVNLIPPLVESVKAYATVGEMAGTLREVFGEFISPSIF